MATIDPPNPNQAIIDAEDTVFQAALDAAVASIQSSNQPYSFLPTSEYGYSNLAPNPWNHIPVNLGLSTVSTSNSIVLSDRLGNEGQLNIGENGLQFKDINGTINLQDMVSVIKAVAGHDMQITSTGNNHIFSSLGTYNTPYYGLKSEMQLLDLPSGVESIYLEIEDGHFIMKYTLMGQLKAEARAFLKIPVAKILNIAEQFASVDISKETLRADQLKLEFEIKQNELVIKDLNQQLMKISGDYAGKQVAITNEFAAQMKDLVIHMNETRKMLNLVSENQAYWKDRAEAAEKELEERKRSTDDFLILD